MKKLLTILIFSSVLTGFKSQKCFYNDMEVQKYLAQNTSFRDQSDVTIRFSNSGGVFSTGMVGSTMYYLDRVTLLSYSKAVLTYYDYQNTNLIVKILLNCENNTITDLGDKNVFRSTKDLRNDSFNQSVQKNTKNKRK